jgi:thymidine phosphorylase
MLTARELIRKKREGDVLDRAEIRAFVAGVTAGEVSDAQIAAFAMATWFRGMRVEEQTELTLAMRDSGAVLQWPGLDGPVVDKHSTGGVGDLVSLILGPVLAACGAYVPMISGRGLGHTGGTLDKLESIPGFASSFGIERLQRQVRDLGLAIVGQSAELAPADRRIYAVRDVTATVTSTPLIVSSILSKKLAEGLDALVMDIKYGCGAVSASVGEARDLAVEICRVAGSAGLPCRALITNMDQPLAAVAGNALEVAAAVRFLRGDGRDARVEEVTLALCAEALSMSGLAADESTGRAMARSALDSGEAAERFGRMVVAQGGPADLLQHPEAHLPQAPVCRAVAPKEPGFVRSIDTEAIGMTVVRLGGGRRRAEDAIDAAVGLSQIRRLGGAVGPDAPLAVVHAADEADWERAASALRAAVEVEPEPGAVPRLVECRLGDHSYVDAQRNAH